MEPQISNVFIGPDLSGLFVNRPQVCIRQSTRSTAHLIKRFLRTIRPHIAHRETTRQTQKHCPVPQKTHEQSSSIRHTTRTTERDAWVKFFVAHIPDPPLESLPQPDRASDLSLATTSATRSGSDRYAAGWTVTKWAPTTSRRDCRHKIRFPYSRRQSAPVWMGRQLVSGSFTSPPRYSQNGAGSLSCHRMGRQPRSWQIVLTHAGSQKLKVPCPSIMAIRTLPYSLGLFSVQSPHEMLVPGGPLVNKASRSGACAA